MPRGARELGAALAAVVLLTACGSSATGQAPSPSAESPSSNPATTPTPPFTASEAREAANPDPSFDYGFTIQATADGFHPRWLVSICCRPVIWKNMTTAPVTVVFDHLGLTSGPISPGSAWLFTPKNVQSITYHSGADTTVHAVLQVNQPLES